jgi:hypothetical protein
MVLTIESAYVLPSGFTRVRSRERTSHLSGRLGVSAEEGRVI